MAFLSPSITFCHEIFPPGNLFSNGKSVAHCTQSESTNFCLQRYSGYGGLGLGCGLGLEFIGLGLELFMHAAMHNVLPRFSGSLSNCTSSKCKVHLCKMLTNRFVCVVGAKLLNMSTKLSTTEEHNTATEEDQTFSTTYVNLVLLPNRIPVKSL